MEYKVANWEKEVAGNIEKVSNKIAVDGVKYEHIKELRDIKSKTALTLNYEGSTNIYEFLDGILGAAIILLMGGGVNLYTSNSASGVFKTDYKALCFLICDLLECFTAHKSREIIFLARQKGNSLRLVVIGTGKIRLTKKTKMAVKLLKANISELFTATKTGVIININLKESSHKSFEPVLSYEYLSDPLSEIYIYLCDFCKTPIQ